MQNLIHLTELGLILFHGISCKSIPNLFRSTCCRLQLQQNSNPPASPPEPDGLRNPPDRFRGLEDLYLECFRNLNLGAVNNRPAIGQGVPAARTSLYTLNCHPLGLPLCICLGSGFNPPGCPHDMPFRLTRLTLEYLPHDVSEFEFQFILHRYVFNWITLIQYDLQNKLDNFEVVYSCSLFNSKFIVSL